MLDPGPSLLLGGADMEKQTVDDETLSRLERFAREMERIRFSEYITFMNDPKRIIFTNLLAGLARGFGMAVGFSVLAAAFVLFLRRLVLLNLPWINEFLTNLLEMTNGNISP
jgi:hypothetical protein